MDTDTLGATLPEYRQVLVVFDNGELRVHWIPELSVDASVEYMLATVDGADDAVLAEKPRVDTHAFIELLKLHVALGTFTAEQLAHETAELEAELAVNKLGRTFVDAMKKELGRGDYLRFKAPPLPVTVTGVCTVYTHA